MVPLEGEFHQALTTDTAVHFLPGLGIVDVGHAVGIHATAVAIARDTGSCTDVVHILDGLIVLAAGAQAFGIAQVHVTQAEEHGAVRAFLVTVERSHAAVAVTGVRSIPVGGIEAGVAVYVQLGGHLAVVGVGVQPGRAVESDADIEAGFTMGPLLEGLVGIGLEERTVRIEGILVILGPAIMGGIGDAGVLVVVGVFRDTEALVGEVQVHHFLGGAEAQTTADALILATLVERSELIVDEIVVGQTDQDLLRIVREVGDRGGLAVRLVMVDGAVGILHRLEGIIAAVKLVQELLVGIPCALPLSLLLALVLREQLGAVFVLDAGIVGVAVEQRAGGIEQRLGLQSLADAPVHAAQVGVPVLGGKVLGGLVQFGDDEVDVLVHRISSLEQFLQRGIQRNGLLAEDGHRAVAAEDVEVVVGAKGAGLRFPQGPVGLTRIRAFIHVADEGAGLGDGHVVAVVPIADPVGRGIGRTHRPARGFLAVAAPGDIALDGAACPDTAAVIRGPALAGLVGDITIDIVQEFLRLVAVRESVFQVILRSRNGREEVVARRDRRDDQGRNRPFNYVFHD